MFSNERGPVQRVADEYLVRVECVLQLACVMCHYDPVADEFLVPVINRGNAPYICCYKVSKKDKLLTYHYLRWAGILFVVFRY